MDTFLDFLDNAGKKTAQDTLEDKEKLLDPSKQRAGSDRESSQISIAKIGETNAGLVEVLLRLLQTRGQGPHQFVLVAKQFRDLTGQSLKEAVAKALGKPVETPSLAMDFVKKWTWLDYSTIDDKFCIALPQYMYFFLGALDMPSKAFKNALKPVWELYQASVRLAYQPSSGAQQGDPLSDRDIVDAMSLTIYDPHTTPAFSINPAAPCAALGRTLDEAIEEVHPGEDKAEHLQEYIDELSNYGLAHVRALEKDDGILRFSPLAHIVIFKPLITTIMTEYEAEVKNEDLVTNQIEWFKELRFWLLWIREKYDPNGGDAYRREMSEEAQRWVRMISNGERQEILPCDTAIPIDLICLYAESLIQQGKSLSEIAPNGEETSSILSASVQSSFATRRLRGDKFMRTPGKIIDDVTNTLKTLSGELTEQAEALLQEILQPLDALKVMLMPTQAFDNRVFTKSLAKTALPDPDGVDILRSLGIQKPEDKQRVTEPQQHVRDSMNIESFAYVDYTSVVPAIQRYAKDEPWGVDLWLLRHYLRTRFTFLSNRFAEANDDGERKRALFIRDGLVTLMPLGLRDKGDKEMLLAFTPNRAAKPKWYANGSFVIAPSMPQAFRANKWLRQVAPLPQWVDFPEMKTDHGSTPKVDVSEDLVTIHGDVIALTPSLITSRLSKHLRVLSDRFLEDLVQKDRQRLEKPIRAAIDARKYAAMASTPSQIKRLRQLELDAFQKLSEALDASFAWETLQDDVSLGCNQLKQRLLRGKDLPVYAYNPRMDSPGAAPESYMARLLPLSIGSAPACSFAVLFSYDKENHAYTPVACLTLAQAYAAARVIAPVNARWLPPEVLN